MCDSLIDVDGSGRIDNDEVKNALAKMKRGGMPADEVARIDDVFKSLMDDTVRLLLLLLLLLMHIRDVD